MKYYPKIARRVSGVWASADGVRVEPGAPVPLVVYQAPSLSRSMAVQALEAADGIGGLAVAGVLLWVVGVFFETVGDAQLSAYRARPRDERPPVLDTGLWAWTRHPNYFGEFSFWLALALFGIAAAPPEWWWLIIGAVYMLRAVRNVLHGPVADGWNEVVDANAWRKLPFVVLLFPMTVVLLPPSMRPTFR